MANIYKTRIDIKNVNPNFKPVFVQYDHAIIEIEMTDNGKIYNLSNAERVEFTHIRGDDAVIIQPGEIVTNGNKQVIRYEYQGSEMDVVGTIKTSFAIFDANNKKVSSHAFEVAIVKDLRDETFEPAEPNFGLLQTLINDVEFIKENGGIGGIGEKGDPFTYDDFTQSQLESLRGPKGEKGDPFRFEDFTQAQLDELRIINDSTVTPKQTTFFDEKKAIPLDFYFGFIIANSVGTIALGNLNVTYDPVPVEPNQTYFFSSIEQIAYYRSDGSFINIELLWGGSHVRTMADDVHFIRISTADAANYVFAKSDKPITYEEANSESLKVEYIPNLPYTKIRDLKDAVLSSISDKKGVACYGDSLTEGAGTSNAGIYSYPVRLQEFIDANNNGYSVINRGVGGEVTRNIMVRQGSYADFVEPFTIPNTTNAVAITKTDVSGVNGIKNGVNPVTIKGVKGNLSVSGNTFYFARLEPGEVVNVDRPTPIIRASAIEDKNKIQIMYMGENGGFDDDPDKLISQYRRMVDFIGHNKYLIIGLTTGTASTRAVIELKLESAFGINYINLRKYVVDYGLLDNDLEPTENDIIAISEGRIPPQLLADTVHFNSNGYYSVAKAIYARGQELDFWK